MKLSLAIVTDDLPRLRSFYETLFRVPAASVDSYAEFELGVGWVLAIVTNDAIDFAVPGAHAPGTNRCIRIELAVADPDAEYKRLQNVVSEWVAPPTDWPWGTRATWLRDPDGNLVSLFRGA